MHDGVSVHAVICDDVRTELNGKITLVGMHLRGVTVNGTAPAGLPQLWLALWVTYPVSPMPEVIRIVAKGDTLEGAPFDITIHPGQDATAEGGIHAHAEQALMELILNRWAPVFFKGDGTLMVEVFADGKLVFANHFPVTIAPSSNPQIPPAIVNGTSPTVVS